MSNKNSKKQTIPESDRPIIQRQIEDTKTRINEVQLLLARWDRVSNVYPLCNQRLKQLKTRLGKYIEMLETGYFTQ